MISLPALAAGAWTAALVVVPVAIIAAGCLRVLPCRPATRHAIWATLLLVLLVLPALPPAPTPSLVRAVTTVVANDAMDEPSSAADADADATPVKRGLDLDLDVEPDSIPAVDPVLASSPAAPQASAPASTSTATTSRPAGPRRPSATVLRESTPSVMVPEWTIPARSESAETARIQRPRLSTARTPAIPAGGDARPADPRWTDRPAAPRVEARTTPLNTPSEPAMRRPRDRAGFAAPLAGTPMEPAAAAELPTMASASASARNAESPRVIAAPVPEQADRTGPLKVDAVARPVDAVVAATPSPEAQAVQVWLARLRDVRDALVRVPLIPTSIWAAGAATVALIALVRCVAFRRRLGRAEPADGATRGLVLAVAQDCGIERAPEVRMTADASSPMLWCGPCERPMLVLPTGLWAELDSLGRRAVVAHELAHLRRRDHIGCWLSLLVGCLYWWHPVVWFVRRRLEEEADHCCDAWVTTLLPEARRAYATALLRARAMSSGSVHAPGPAMSLTTTRTRRFARRLTMVMSRTTRPNASVGGALLAVGLAAGSWLASPALACPPDEKGTAVAPVATTIGMVPLRAERPDAPATVRGIAALPAPVTPRAPVAPVAPRAPTAALAPPAPRAPSIAVAPSAPRFPVARAGDARGRISRGVGANADAARLEVLEARMSRMEAMLERLVVAVEGGRAAAPAPARFPEDVVAFGAVVDAVEAQRPATEIVIQSEKGEAFWELLARDDVAIQVSRDGDRIIVLGPDRNGMLAEAFAAMVTSDEKTYRRMDIAPQHVDAVWEFMSRSDVPVWVRREGDGIAVEGTPLQHLVFEAFAGAMVGEGDGSTADRAGRAYAEALRRLPAGQAAANDPAGQRAIQMIQAQRAQQEAAEMAQMAELARREATRALAGQQAMAEHQIAVAQLRLVMNQLDVEMTQTESRFAQLEVEAAQLDRRAAELEQLEERLRSEWEDGENAIEAIEAEIDEVTEAGGEGSREQIRSLRRKMRDVKRRMDELEREADQIEREHDHLQEVEEDLEAMADALEEQAEELEEAREELMDRLEEMEEELVERLERDADVLPGMIDESSDECGSACAVEVETDCSADCQ